MASEKQKIGLALGGGAVLGAAHIGVLKAFEENDIRLAALTGTSIGAFIAALYAFGKSADEISEFVHELDWLDVTSLSLSKFGLLSNEKMGERLTEILGEVRFDQAKIPFALVATDLSSGKKELLKQGEVARAVTASACVPGIFAPVDLDGCMLVDGGLLENVPISPLADLGAELTIGVDLSANRRFQPPEDLIDVLTSSIDIALDNATRIQTSDADFVIKPELAAYSRTDTSKTDTLIAEGHKAALVCLDELFG